VTLAALGAVSCPFTARAGRPTLGLAAQRAATPSRGEKMKLMIRLAAAATAGLLAAGCASAGPPSASPTASPTPSPPTSAPASAPGSATPAPFAYQPLFPFESLAEVRAWQASYASSGHQAWHLNPGLTALAFTQGYLGFSRIGKLAALRISGGDAHVTVGFHRPDGHVSAAAVIHLVKYGSGRNVPWEVVGTDDTTLTLDVPAYGGIATSPVRIGGKITGVDESLRAEVHRLGAGGPVGSFCCQPAGGQASPWSFSVPFHATPGQVITIVVHTGGHVAAVERFAVTGARVG
jgi:hypothetical protein